MISNKIKEIIEKRKTCIEKESFFMDSIKGKNYRDNRKPLSKAIKNNPETPIISEIKLASPTLGAIRKKFDVKSLATEMECSGVVGLSILTEPNYFKGSYENLRLAVMNTKLPCLMKDFVIDPIQFKIAAQLGATNILLINSICNIFEMYRLAIDNDLEPLIEIHEIEEIKKIRNLFENGFKPKLVGVNNRNLKTMNIDLMTSMKIIPRLKEEFGEKIQVISESGIKSIEDINLIKPSGVNGFLVGSSIMQSHNIRRKILDLRGIS
ncbi:MAG: indole-3-glycerol-phosphate synthase [Promethearchaeota archaeon]|jgi:indole-3-glycerol phosphate synthase